MTMTPSLIIFAAAYLLYWAATTRYDTQMFQQNSYRPERWRRWWLSTGEWASRSQLLSLSSAAIFAFTWHPALLYAYAAWAAVFAWAEFSMRYKIRLVYTMRIKRLLATRTLLTAAAIALTASYAPHWTLSVAMLLTMQGWVVVFDLINRPVERAVTRWYYNDARRILRSMPGLTIIGITGSFGKTSTKHFLHRILSEKYNVLMTPGNYNTTLGVVRTVREQLKPYHNVFIVEMGAKQRGDIREICELVHPSIGIVTSVGEMHLETFGSVENVARTKFELIESLPAGGLGVVNIDSEAAARYGCRTAADMLTYSVDNPEADYRAGDIGYSAGETTFSVTTPDERRDGFMTHILGSGNILNITAALAVADRLGIPVTKQRTAVAQIRQIEHRLSIRRSGGITILDDAYNSNPAGARMALDVLSRFAAEGRRIVVTPGFVEMGARQYDNNRELGRHIAMSGCDMAYIVNEVNRQAITEGLRECSYPEERIHVVETFAEASSRLAATMRTGDVVLYENDLPDSFK